MTLALLWYEYRAAHPNGYGYSRFCELYRAWAGTLDVTMRHEHKAGEKLFVDYTGHKMEVVNPQTGEVSEVEVFVAAQGASNYTYAEPSWSQGLRDWIGSHVREWACETVHTLNDSKRSYRLICIRKERLDPDLFEGPYTHHAIITNMDLPLEQQIAWSRQRGKCEKQIGELKWDFELRVMPSGDFFVNAVYLRIMTLAYNLFVALKTLTLSGDLKKARLKTVLFRLLKVPALVVKRARRIWIKLPRGHPAVPFFRTMTNYA